MQKCMAFFYYFWFMKYSKGFERDYNFYLSNIGSFNFCGTLNPKHTAISGGELSAKECLYYIESEGKNKPCKEPGLLNQLLLTKAAVNFQIKQWSESVNDGTLFLFELSKDYWRKLGGGEIETKILEWVNKEPVYFNDIQELYGLPEWVIKAVDNQRKAA